MSQRPQEEDETAGAEKRRPPLVPSSLGRDYCIARSKKAPVTGPHVQKVVARNKGTEISGSRRWTAEAGATEAGRRRGRVDTYQRSERGWWRCPGRPRRPAGAAWWRRSQPRGRSGSRPGPRALKRPLQLYLPVRASRLGSTTPRNRRMETTSNYFRDGSFVEPGPIPPPPAPTCAAGWFCHWLRSGWRLGLMKGRFLHSSVPW